MTDPPTYFDRLWRGLKDHPVLAWLGIVVIVLAGALGLINGGLDFLSRASPSLSVEMMRVSDTREEIAKYRDLLPVDTGTYFMDLEAVDALCPPDTIITITTRGILTDTLENASVPIRRSPCSPDSLAAARSLGHLQALGGTPVVDLVLRNSSSRPAVITQLDYRATRQRFDDNVGACSMGFTAAYHILLHADSAVQSGRLDLVQEVPPNTVARFGLLIAYGTGQLHATGEYTLHVRFSYNGGETLMLEPFRVLMEGVCQAPGRRLRMPFGMQP